MIFLPICSKEILDLISHLNSELSVGIRSVYFHDPLVQELLFFLDELSVIVVELLNQVVDVTHHIREKKHADKLKKAIMA